MRERRQLDSRYSSLFQVARLHDLEAAGVGFPDAFLVATQIVILEGAATARLDLNRKAEVVGNTGAPHRDLATSFQIDCRAGGSATGGDRTLLNQRGRACTFHNQALHGAVVNACATQNNTGLFTDHSRSI